MPVLCMKKLSDCRVLLVDDAKANLDILVEGLKSEYKLSLALNGEMTLQAAARTPPDLILLDIGGQDAGAVTVKLSGSLDTATAPELDRQLAPVLGGPVKDLVFDLAHLKFISSAGLRLFSTVRKTLKGRGGQVSFVNLQPQIQEVFEIMKSLPGVAVFKDVAELDRYLAARQCAHAEDQ